MTTNLYTENLFSYGTLQYESVQLATFGRKLTGKLEILPGFHLSKVQIKDANVIATSGDATHPIIRYTGDLAHQVKGTTYLISPAELKKADEYEVADYKRIAVKLASGLIAWVYVSVDVEYPKSTP